MIDSLNEPFSTNLLFFCIFSPFHYSVSTSLVCHLQESLDSEWHQNLNATLLEDALEHIVLHCLPQRMGISSSLTNSHEHQIGKAVVHYLVMDSDN